MTLIVGVLLLMSQIVTSPAKVQDRPQTAPIDVADVLPRDDSLETAVLISRSTAGATVRGSGVTIVEDQQHWYVLTNAHVAGSTGQAVECIFFRRGYSSRPVRGQVVWASYQRGVNAGGDVAMVAVSKAALGNLQVAKADISGPGVAEPTVTIDSAGCPQGSWPNMFRGHVVSVSGDLIKFRPRPIEGRSGSAVYDAANRLIGLVTWADDEELVGYAQSWRAIRTAMQGQRLGAAGVNVEDARPCGLVTIPWIEPSDPQETQETQCPGGTCPSPPMAPRPHAPQPNRPGVPPVPSTPDTPGNDAWPGMPAELRRDPQVQPGPLPDPAPADGGGRAPSPPRDNGGLRDWLLGRPGDGQKRTEPAEGQAGGMAGLLGRRLESEIRAAVEQLVKDATRTVTEEVRRAVDPEKFRTSMAEMLRDIMRSAGQELRPTMPDLKEFQQLLQETNQSLTDLKRLVWPLLIATGVLILVRLVPWSLLGSWTRRAAAAIAEPPPGKTLEDHSPQGK